MCFKRETVRGRSTVFELRCGGSLVTQNHILTAAHCLFEEKTGQKREVNDDLLVVLGSNDPLYTSEGLERKIISYTYHPNYVYPQSYFDVAVCTLNETVPQAAFRSIRPVCLPG